MKFRASAALLALLATGCGKVEDSRRYRAPKDPQWRMLAAAASGRDFTWFFKVTGPAELVGPGRAQVVDFLKSLREEEGEIRWTAPPGWVEESASGDRQSVLRFGADLPKLEMSVVKLPGDGGGALANVNRWRGQMGLPKIGQEALEAHVGKVEAAVPVLLVELSGPKRPSSRPPHMGGGGGQAGGGDTSLDDVRSMFAYQLPSGWEENPEPGQQRIFEFRAGPDAVVTFTILGGEAGGLAANLNRWRMQAGLEAVAEDQAATWTKQVKFLDREGWSTEAVGKDRAIVVTFALNPQFSMFLKMDGPPAAVRAQRESFEALSRSFKMERKRG